MTLPRRTVLGLVTVGVAGVAAGCDAGATGDARRTSNAMVEWPDSWDAIVRAEILVSTPIPGLAESWGRDVKARTLSVVHGLPGATGDIAFRRHICFGGADLLGRLPKVGETLVLMLHKGPAAAGGWLVGDIWTPEAFDRMPKTGRLARAKS